MNDESYINQTQTPLIDHLIELRKRLIWCVVYIVIGFCVAYFFKEDIYSFLAQPFVETAHKYNQDARMIYTGMHEAFFVYLKLSFFASLCASFPLLLIQIWKFVAPGLYKNEKMAFFPFLLATPVLFTLGAVLAYYLIIPNAWDFFMSYQMTGASDVSTANVQQGLSIELLPAVSEYWSLTMLLILAFGISFQLPILLLLLARVGIVTADSLKKARKYMIVGAFAFAAVMTPPDLISQIGLGIPIILLYELSIIAIQILIKGSKDV